MPNPSVPPTRAQGIRRIWKPTAGGAALSFWLEEILLFAEEILALVFLPILAGAIYLLDILIFKSRMPQRKDLRNTKDRGVKK